MGTNLNGAARIVQERLRVLNHEGYPPEHDLEHHKHGEMVDAAVAYMFSAPNGSFAKIWWPWKESEYKPDPDPIQNLIKAGQLIAAEIDRLQALRDKES